MFKADTEGFQWESIVWRSATQYGSCKMWSHTLRLSCQISEYDTCWHLVRHKHKLLSPHTNVKHPSSWIHTRAPTESRINDASLPYPVTTNLRGWLPSVICDATLPPWGEFQAVTAGLRYVIWAAQPLITFILQQEYKSKNSYEIMRNLHFYHLEASPKVPHHTICPLNLLGVQNVWGLQH